MPKKKENKAPPKKTKNVATILGGIIFALLAVIIIIYIATPSGPCSDVNNKYDRQSCLADVAIGNQSVVLCNDVSDTDLKEYCISEIAVATDAPQLCGLLTNQSHGSCITDIALDRKDISLCQPLLIVNERWLDVCQMQVSIELNETDSCEDIGFADLRDSCLQTLNEPRQDPELCKKMVISATRHRCIRDVALFHDDVSLCRSIQDPLYRDSQCFKKFAQKESNRDFCEMISSLQIRINCYEKVLDINIVKNGNLVNFSIIKELDLKIDDELLPEEFRD